MTRYHKNPEAIAKLTPEQYRVTQQSGTERPAAGAYLHNKAPGIYVDIVSGEPLFASSDNSNPAAVGRVSRSRSSRRTSTSCATRRHGMIRTEVRSAHGDSHLGHVFPDGPRGPRRMRYCINSASLRFVPRDGWRPRAMATTRSSGGDHDDENERFWRADASGECRICCAAMTACLDPRRLYGRRRAECDLPQSWHARRGDRDHLRSVEGRLSADPGVLLSDP